MPWWKFVTGPAFKYVLIVLLGAILGWFASDRYKVQGLEVRIFEIQQSLAKAEADLQSARQSALSADDSLQRSERDCDRKIEALKNRPTQEINPDAEVDDSLIERLRRGGMRDSGKGGSKTDAPAPRTDPKAPGAQAP